MRKTRRGALTAAALAAVMVLTGCAPTDDGQITAANASLKSQIPELTSVPEAGRAALEVTPTDYLMLHPAELTTGARIPADGLRLTATLPAALPPGTQARFTFFDEELGVWVPVDTTVDGRQASAVVTHLSLWSIVVTGAEDALRDAADAFEDAGAAVSEFAAQAADSVGDAAGTIGDAYVDGLVEWSTNGPGAWILRNGGLALGIAAPAPECVAGAYPAWVEVTDLPVLTGIPAENLSVLRCAGTDPVDPSLIQIKAVANRGFGFPVEVAPGVTPKRVSTTEIAETSLADLSDLLDQLAAWAANGALLDPRHFVYSASQIELSFSEADVRAVEEGQPLVMFPKPRPGQAALSVLYSYVLGQGIDAVPGITGIALALRDCDPHGLPLEGEPAEWVGYLLECVKAVGDEEFQERVDEFVKEHATRTDWPAPLEKLGGTEGVKLLRKVLAALKWVDVVSAGLTLIDYAGERDELSWLVYVYPHARQAAWEDVNGTWCDSSNPSYCWTINLPTDGEGHPVALERADAGCFTGLVSFPEYAGAPPEGFYFCPAGVPSIDRVGQTGDNPAFDRIWYGPGVQPPTMFRQEELAAATGR